VQGAQLERALTAARYPDVEERARGVLQALVSSLRDAAGDSWAGAALGGAAAHGEASGNEDEPFQLLAIVEAPQREVPLLEKKLRRALAVTARSRHAACRLAVAGRASLPFLPPTLFVAELLEARHLLDGPADLLSPARVAGALPPEEALRLLVRAGARIVEGERAMARDPHAGRESAFRALQASEDVDLALGAAVLLSEGRWVAGERAREEALGFIGRLAPAGIASAKSPAGHIAVRSGTAGIASAKSPAGHIAVRSGTAGIASAKSPATASEVQCVGFRARMTWTRFHDLVEAHRRALLGRSAPETEVDTGEARRRLVQSADRWLEVLRLSEEDRLGEPLPNWDVHARALFAHRRHGRTAGLFEGDEEERPLPSRREIRGWPLPERLAPAAGALVDWDPGDLEVATLLLDLPADASRDALRARFLSLGEDL